MSAKPPIRVLPSRTAWTTAEPGDEHVVPLMNVGWTLVLEPGFSLGASTLHPRAAKHLAPQAVVGQQQQDRLVKYMLRVIDSQSRALLEVADEPPSRPGRSWFADKAYRLKDVVEVYWRKGTDGVEHLWTVIRTAESGARTQLYEIELAMFEAYPLEVFDFYVLSPQGTPESMTIRQLVPPGFELLPRPVSHAAG